MRQRDFHTQLDLAASSVNDALCTVRAAGIGRLPIPHRQLIQRITRSLERTQQDLFQLKEDPWQQEPRAPRQLHLL